MKKIKASWKPELEQDFSAMTSKNSPFYDEEYTLSVIEKYGNLDNFKKSDKWKELQENYEQ
mgnify:CR=1 FL=1